MGRKLSDVECPASVNPPDSGQGPSHAARNIPVTLDSSDKDGDLAGGESVSTEVRPEYGDQVRSETHEFHPSTIVFGAGGPLLGFDSGVLDSARERLGDYELLEPLDAGGEGMVYRARHRLNDHIVALKMLPPSLNRDQHAIHRLREEARAIAALQHDHIVPIHFMGEEAGTWYYTMPLMPGGSLKNRNDRDVRNIVRLLIAVSRGIHHAHTRGVLHLDLKPANVLLDDQGRPYVSDFGLALRLDTALPENNAFYALPAHDQPGGSHASVTLTSPQIRGTAPYMSPEVASGQTSVFSTAADVYGLGALLYTLLTGRPPFEGPTLAETLKRVAADSPIPPQKLNRKVDRELQAICLKCLEKDPSARYASADALAGDLVRRLRGEPTLAGGPTWPKRAWFAVCRRPWFVSLSMIALLLLGLATQVGSLPPLHESGARDAHRLASYVGKELEMIRRVVKDSRTNPELLDALRDPVPFSQHQKLERFLQTRLQEFLDWFGHGVESPLKNLFVLDSRGTLLADTENSLSIGQSFEERDYFRHFQETVSTPKLQSVYISRVFHSRKDGLYKISLAVPIQDVANQLDGVFIANIAVSARLGMIDLNSEPTGASIVAPMDWSYGSQEVFEPSGRAPFIAVLDRRYAEQTQPMPLFVWQEDAPQLPHFESHPGLQVAHDYGHRGGAILYERVPDSPLIVLVRQKYPWPASVLLEERYQPTWLAMGVSGLLALAWPIFTMIRKSEAAALKKNGV